MTYVAVRCVTWIKESLQHIGTSIYVPMAEAIDADLAANPSTELLGKFYVNDAGVDAVHVRKTI